MVAWGNEGDFTQITVIQITSFIYIYYIHRESTLKSGNKIITNINVVKKMKSNLHGFWVMHTCKD